MGRDGARLRIGVVGVGHWHFPLHLAALGTANARVVGVCDERPEVSARWARELGCTAYPDAEVLVEADVSDFVYALPAHDRAPAIVRLLLEHGLACMVEKPMGVAAAQIRPLADLQDSGHAFVAVPLVHRFSAFWRCVHAHASEAIHGHFRVIRGPAQRYADAGVGWMLDPARSGGGALRNLGFHVADLAVAVADGVPAVIAARTRSHPDGVPGIEDSGTALLETPSGIPICVEAGYTLRDADGTDLELRLALPERYVVERDGTLTVADGDGTRSRPAARDPEKYRAFGVDTLARYRRGEAPITSIADCWRAAQLIDSIYLAASGSSRA